MNLKGLFLFLTVSVLCIIGMVMVFNTTSAEVLDSASTKDIHYALIKQSGYAVVGILLAFCVYFVGYEKVLKHSGSLLLVFSFLLLLALIPGIGVQLNGARRWLSILGFSFQPSEFVKYLIPMYFIQEVIKQKNKIELLFFFQMIGKILIPVILILLEPDNGTVFIIGVTVTVLCFLTRIPFRFFFTPLIALGLIAGGVALKMDHVADRIRVFMHPESDLLGKGHQPYQAKIAAGSGQLFGRGLGESLQKMHYLPEARSDYIAAIFAEEFGFTGITLMIICYLLICFLGYKISIEAKTFSGFYLAAIFMFLLCFQAFFNLGVVSGLLPSKGTTLPFFSQGGTSLLASFFAVSMILSVSQSYGSQDESKKA